MPDPALQADLNLPFQEQIDFFRAKLNLPTERWDDILHGAHDRAFVVAGAMKADLLDDLRQAVAPLQRTTQEAFNKAFKAAVQRHGWHGWTGEGTRAGEAWRMRVIYETNVRASHAAGRYRQLTDPATLNAMPYWRYVHNDSVMHPRQHHKDWGDMRLTLRHDDPFWKTHFPPNGWGCRCRVTAVRGPAEGDSTEPPAGWDQRDAKGNLPGIDKGWDYAPGAQAATPLADLVGQKLIKLDAGIGAAMWQHLKPALAMETELAWWRTLDDWLAARHASKQHFILGAISPRTLDWLKANGKPLPPTAEVVIFDKLPTGAKQRRHASAGNALSVEEWRTLPALLDRPSGIYYDRHSGNLIYVADGLGPGKIAIEFRPRETRKIGDYNQVAGAFRVDDATVAGQVKGGEWIVVEMPGSRVGVEPT